MMVSVKQTGPARQPFPRPSRLPREFLRKSRERLLIRLGNHLHGITGLLSSHPERVVDQGFSSARVRDDRQLLIWSRAPVRHLQSLGIQGCRVSGSTRGLASPACDMRNRARGVVLAHREIGQRSSSIVQAVTAALTYITVNHSIK